MQKACVISRHKFSNFIRAFIAALPIIGLALAAMFGTRQIFSPYLPDWVLRAATTWVGGGIIIVGGNWDKLKHCPKRERYLKIGVFLLVWAVFAIVCGPPLEKP